MTREQPIERRTDLSRFLVHLTRDDSGSFDNGKTARTNLLSILKHQKLLAARPHCLHHKKIKQLPLKYRSSFNVVCFTEVPLDQLEEIVGDISGRRIELEPYGIVFSKSYLIDRGAQQAIYINNYGSNSLLRDAADRIFAGAVSSKCNGKGWRLLPYVNIMHDKHDFSWEREWRFRGDFRFKASELVAVIIPSREKKIRNDMNSIGVPCIEPGWTYERIVEELSSQHHATAKDLESLRATSVKEKVESEDVDDWDS